MSQQPREQPRERPGRYQRSTGALIGSMLVLLVVVVGFVVFRGFFRGNQDVAIPTVDYAAAARQARSEGKVLAAAPDPMPRGWRATSARYIATPSPTWHLGILTGDETYVGIEESRQTAGVMVAQFLGGGARQTGEVSVGGASWDSWRTDDGYALTRTTPLDTLFVGGPAGERATRELAGRLAPAEVRAG